jgi:hypothetical protein
VSAHKHSAVSFGTPNTPSPDAGRSKGPISLHNALGVHGRSGDALHRRSERGRNSARRRMRPSLRIHVPTTTRNKTQPKYNASAQKPTSPIPANHKTTSTAATGRSKNHSYARTILPLRMRTPGSSYTLLPSSLACVGLPGRTHDLLRLGNLYQRGQLGKSNVTVS